jgi:hypothetical protein
MQNVNTPRTLAERQPNLIRRENSPLHRTRLTLCRTSTLHDNSHWTGNPDDMEVDLQVLSCLGRLPEPSHQYGVRRWSRVGLLW